MSGIFIKEEIDWPTPTDGASAAQEYSSEGFPIIDLVSSDDESVQDERNHPIGISDNPQKSVGRKGVDFGFGVVMGYKKRSKEKRLVESSSSKASKKVKKRPPSKRKYEFFEDLTDDEEKEAAPAVVHHNVEHQDNMDIVSGSDDEDLTCDEAMLPESAYAGSAERQTDKKRQPVSPPPPVTSNRQKSIVSVDCNVVNSTSSSISSVLAEPFPRKPAAPRTVFSDAQEARLKEVFDDTPYISKETTRQLAVELDIRLEVVHVSLFSSNQ